MASKKESTFISMTITLLLVSCISAISLGYVYEYTKGPIEDARLLKKTNAIKEVVPNFDNNPLAEVTKVGIQKDTLYFYPAKKSGQLTGVAVETFSNGFGGTIKLMVGFLPDGSINNIAVLKHSETPGLGDKMDKAKSFNKKTGKSWSDQFNGKNPESFKLMVKKDGGDVDAITAATISSRAFCNALQKAVNEFKNTKQE